eukprot:GILK01003938.1.p1 GENE.GILK01003938.1~~GILK01003938.1.p1  ORF type:complete len:665 (-),score=109.71 GILK01003938.1:229-2223(-)
MGRCESPVDKMMNSTSVIAAVFAGVSAYISQTGVSLLLKALICTPMTYLAVRLWTTWREQTDEHGGVTLPAHVLLTRFILRKIQKFDPVGHITMHKETTAPMRDGIVLKLTHCYVQGTYHKKLPVVLIRTPYGRGMAKFTAERFADQGYHVLYQDCRGRFGSDGEFFPIVAEQNDGVDTMKWIEQQHFFDGNIVMYGVSYLGIVQYALVDHAPKSFKAMVPALSCSYQYPVMFPHGALHYELIARWLYIVLVVLSDESFFKQMWKRWFTNRVVDRITAHLPIGEADVHIDKSGVNMFREMLEHPREDDIYWVEKKAKLCCLDNCPPTHLIGGWYDIFLREQLRDYEQLQATNRAQPGKGRVSYLTVGPWHHWDIFNYSKTVFLETLKFFNCQVKGMSLPRTEKPVRLMVMGLNRWKDFECWPPASVPVSLYLHPNRLLSTTVPPATSRPDRYTYDPHDPTPTIGGNSFNPTNTGPADNRPLEKRSDVLVYTGELLTESVTVIGNVKAKLYVRSNLQHTDFVARLLDVHPDGKSICICDGMCRITPEHQWEMAEDTLDLVAHGESSDLVHTKLGQQMDGDDSPSTTVSRCPVICIEVDMWSTANVFLAGHRIRLHVTSAAHPRWCRNLGTGEMYSAARGLVANQELFHDESRPSALILPQITYEL